MRKLMSLISILLLVGCSLEPTAIYNFELELGLEQDGNGYYHLPMDSQGASNQSLYKFAVDTNNPNIGYLIHILMWITLVILNQPPS